MFSIVVPVYNKRSTLSKTIWSVLAQSFADFELILVDDGSTDGSLSAAKGLEDPRVRITSQRNQGPGPARNLGARLARHGWIAFLDADDVWDECHLAELHRIREAHPEAGLIGTSYRMVHSTTGPAQIEQPNGHIHLVDYVSAVADGELILCASTAAVRRDVWQDSGGFGAYPHGQDSEYWVRVASSWPVAISRRVTATYVRDTGGISDQRWHQGFGNPPRKLEDLSPAVMRVLQLRSNASTARVESYNRFIERYIHWRLVTAVQSGDVATARALRRLYERKPSRLDAFLLLFGVFPVPIGRALHRAARAAHIGRILRRGLAFVRLLTSAYHGLQHSGTHWLERR